MIDSKSVLVWKTNNFTAIPQLAYKVVAVFCYNIFKCRCNIMFEYMTIEAASTAQYEEKHSKFIATAYPCGSEEEATNILSQVKSEYWDAKHNVYAYVLKDGTARFSDDGEPHGTAGKPILDVIMGSEVRDVIIIVTRYFGGILLGTGGLVRAYSKSAADALKCAQRLKMCKCAEYATVCDYTYHTRLVSLINESGGTITDTVFADKVTVNFMLREQECEAFNKKLCESFSSRLTATLKKTLLFPIKVKKIEEF